MYQAIQHVLPSWHLSSFTAPRRESLLSYLRAGSSIFSSILLGGGTLINPSYLSIMRNAQRNRLPLYTFGTGVGSVGFAAPPEVSLKGWKEILQECRLLSVRGPLSQLALQELGIKHATIIGDPALSLAPEHLPKQRVKQRLIINLTQEVQRTYGTGEYKIFRCVEEIAKRFVKDGGEALGVALGLGDRAVLNRFRSEADLPEMCIEDCRNSLNSFFQATEGSIGLIGVRLHAAVLASCVGVPSVLISYRRKCEDFMKSIDMAEFAIPFSADSCSILKAKWSQLMEQPSWGEKVCRMAQHWKQKQRCYGLSLLSDLEGTLKLI